MLIFEITFQFAVLVYVRGENYLVGEEQGAYFGSAPLGNVNPSLFIYNVD